MNSRRIEFVHDVPFHKLEQLLSESTGIDDLHLVSDQLLGGMSNLNIEATSGQGDLVVKIPGLIQPYEENPFEKEFSLLTYFAHRNRSPHPIALGFITAKYTIPFMIYSLVPGSVHSDFTTITETQWGLLKDALENVHTSAPSGIPVYSSPSKYLEFLMTDIRLLFEDRILHAQLMADFVRLDRAALALQNIDGVVEKWNTGTIHGDLRPQNIVFQEDNAILLDWNQCCQSNTLYDYAYLSAEPFCDTHTFEFPHYLVNGETRLYLEGVALVSVLSWTLEQMTHIMNRNVDPNLVRKNLLGDMIKYVEQKQHRLDSTVEELILTRK